MLDLLQIVMITMTGLFLAYCLWRQRQRSGRGGDK